MSYNWFILNKNASKNLIIDKINIEIEKPSKFIKWIGKKQMIINTLTRKFKPKMNSLMIPKNGENVK